MYQIRLKQKKEKCYIYINSCLDALKVEFGKTIPPSTSATAVAATPPTMNQPVMVPVPQTAAASVVVTTVSRPVTEPDQQDIGSKAVSKVSEELTDIKIDDPEILDFIQSMKPLDVEVVSPSEQMTFKDKYNLPAGGKGLALIMNIVEFDDELPRKGSDKDLEYMSELWPQLGYELYPKSKKDRELKKRSKEEVIRLIDSFVEKCQASKPKSIVVFVGSHGGLNTIHTSDGKSIHLYGDLVNKFGRESCPVIRACPKIFLIQTCQNIKRNETDSYNSAAPISDALIVTAQVPGHEANRDAFKGSWFIYCLTYVIMNHAHKTSFQDMLKLTRRMVLQIESNANKEGKVLMGQIPVITDIDMDTLYLTLDP